MINGKGECFKTAYELVVSTDNLILVHGLPFGLGGDAEGLRYNHAWCETEEGMVIDMTVPAVISKERYYQLGDIETTYRYTKHEAMVMVSVSGVYGCWEDELKEYP